MPCDSVVTIGVDLKLANSRLILAALEKMEAKHIMTDGGVSFYIDGRYYSLQDGQLNGDRRTVANVADRLKLAYTREAVSMAAKRAGWNVEVKSENKLAVQRRI